MSGAISVTPEQLKSQAKVYQQASSQIQDAIRKVNSMNQQIAQEWKGQAFQSYLEQYNQLEGNVKKMEELLISINGQLTKYADTVAQRDQQDAGSFGLN
ncbi:WXG100 family type VII secretion target [Carnobacterium divergens]|uniref:ESAT-6-like protein n=1 Tax=Carnobacterium divergens TaxID=2748 RepID=A0AAW8RA09_CARDV|nr:WXG100 family type VII secretion target [Carnobacterium divergens]MDT1957731.1 WXG100 family type VII secretion target [Carnobacterium divergens]MDT1973359.1 WXG100 family type VII secretion target [Carnobacterium divergens]MDT2011687.1 WXG100 family type VII secretion target [Carnobacterium divergens]TFJ44261.1 WXG100 family type VII secretion target [Carnobacterium divergens]TFJ52232.1 WXG100 family type VII secretion target [Carnobacterium divergens]